MVRPKFEVDVDHSTCGYRLSMEALSVGIFIGNHRTWRISQHCGPVLSLNTAGACSHQRGGHKVLTNNFKKILVK